jgi:hypothetical protein
MAKAKRKEDVTQSTVGALGVFELLDHHDIWDMQKAIEALAACECGGGAHVYKVPGNIDAFVVSAEPLCGCRVNAAFDEYEDEMVRQQLNDGVSLDDALSIVSTEAAKRWKDKSKKTKVAA